MAQIFVPLADLAEELRIHPKSIFRIAKRLGISAIRQRDPERGNQMVSLVSEAQASAIRAESITNRRSVGAGASDRLGDAGEGWFYLIQLEPVLDPGRIKVGFTTDLDVRLRKHHTAAPLAVYRKHWPCRPTWERAAIDCVSLGLEQIGEEVFRGPSLEELVTRADQFFRLMPALVVASGLDEEDGPEENN